MTKQQQFSYYIVGDSFNELTQTFSENIRCHDENKTVRCERGIE